MAAFSAEQQRLRLQAQNDPSCEPYPLNVPVSWNPGHGALLAQVSSELKTLILVASCTLELAVKNGIAVF